MIVMKSAPNLGQFGIWKGLIRDLSSLVRMIDGWILISMI